VRADTAQLEKDRMVFSDSSSDEDVDIERRKNMKHKRSSRHKRVKSSKHRHRRRERRHSSSKAQERDETSDSDNSEGGKERGHRRRKHKRRDRSREESLTSKPKQSRRTKRSRDDNSSGSEVERRIKDTAEPAKRAPSKYDQFLPQLYELLHANPELANELPYFLIRMGSGASIDLSQVPDVNVARSLRLIFQTLGCEYTPGDDEWKFIDMGGRHHLRQNKDNSALVLVKLARCLMDDQGFTMQAITSHEKQLKARAIITLKSSPTYIHKETVTPADISSEIVSLTTLLLRKFQTKSKDKTSSLSKELYGIMNMILEGEIICLHGIPDEDLRNSIEKLFTVVGLSREEMVEEAEDSDDERDSDDIDAALKQTNFGYVIPDESSDQFDTIRLKLSAATGACKVFHQNFVQTFATKRTLGPSLPPPNASKNVSAFDLKSSDDEDDDIGPAPLGSTMAKKRNLKGRAMPAEEVNQISMIRKAQMIAAKTGIDTTVLVDGTFREEWMLQPGEHDFLKGVMSKGIKNRNFKNERNGMHLNTAPEVPLDPKLQKEVDAIIDMQKEARGVSLVEMHRQQKVEEKKDRVAGDGGKGDWSWSRDNDLDAGRRVDKNHLHMVMGGATTDLKNKFQGSYSKGFM